MRIYPSKLLRIILLFVPYLLEGQSFQKIYRSGFPVESDYAEAIIRRPDGRLIAHSREYISSDSVKTLISCVAPDGTPVWTTVFDTRDETIQHPPTALVDGGVALALEKKQNQLSDGQPIVKLDPNGAVEWSDFLPFINNHPSLPVIVAGSQSIYIAGSKPDWGIYLASLGLDGSVNWERRIRGDSIAVHEFLEMPGGHLLAAVVDFRVKPDYFSLLEFDKQGNLVRSASFSYQSFDLKSVVALNDGKVMLCLNSINLNKQMVIQLDADFYPVWTKRIAEPGTGFISLYPVLIPNQAQDSVTLVYASFYSQYTYFKTKMIILGMDGSLSSAKVVKSGTIANGLRMPDDGLYLIGSIVLDAASYMLMLRTDAHYQAGSCVVSALCNLDVADMQILSKSVSWNIEPVHLMTSGQVQYTQLNLLDENFCLPDTVFDARISVLDTTPCVGDPIQIQAVDPAGQWYVQGIPAPDNIPPVLTPNHAGPLEIQHIAPGNSCLHDVGKLVLQVQPKPVVHLPADTAICPGDSILVLPIVSTPGLDFVWNDGSVAPDRKISDPGVYVLEGKDTQGCVNKDTIMVKEHERPRVAITGSSLGCEGEAIDLKAVSDAPDAVFHWSTGYSGANLEVRKNGFYRVTVTDALCLGYSDSLRVTFRDCPDCVLFIPNVFAPDQGGLNSRWGVQTNCQILQFDLSVYDRWGNLVFRTGDAGETWDGYFRNRPQPPGVYVCRVRLETDSGWAVKTFEQTADITLIR